MKIPYHTVVSAPAQEPVTVTELAFNLRLVVTDATDYTGPELNLLARLITAAREDVENYIGYAVIAQQWRVHYAQASEGESLALCRYLQSIDSIKYYDINNAQQTLDPNDYQMVNNQKTGSVLIKSIPTMAERPDALEIIFTTGQGQDAASVPGAIKQAIIMLASHYYQNREATSPLKINQVPLSYKWLLPTPQALV